MRYTLQKNRRRLNFGRIALIWSNRSNLGRRLVKPGWLAACTLTENKPL
jgi:hypothetical protein